MKKIEFVASAFNINEIPKDGLPCAVLCGRSNVGKSSFINALFSPLKVARTSSTPGKTRSINYYLVERKFYLVDLPGFGYAKVSKSEKYYWERLITNYFDTNKNISTVFHLIDARHKPQPLDLMLNEFVRSRELPYFLILSKTDKLKQSEIAGAKKAVIEVFPEIIFGTNAFLFSAVKHTGKKEIIKLLSSLYLS
jgi:GTP-binding protein